MKILASFGAEPDSMFLAVAAAIFDHLQVSTGRHDELAKKLIDLHSEFYPKNANSFVRLLTAKDSLLQQLQKTASRYELLAEYAFCLRQAMYREIKKAGDYYFPISLGIAIEKMHMPGIALSPYFLEAIANALEIKIKINMQDTMLQIPHATVYNKMAGFFIRLSLTNQHYLVSLSTPTFADAISVRKTSTNSQALKDDLSIKTRYAELERTVLETFKAEQSRLVTMFNASDIETVNDLSHLYIKALRLNSVEHFAGLERGVDAVFRALEARHWNLSNIETPLRDPFAKEYINALAKCLALKKVDHALIYGDDEESLNMRLS